MPPATLILETKSKLRYHTHEEFAALGDKFVNAPTDEEARICEEQLVKMFYEDPHAED